MKKVIRNKVAKAFCSKAIDEFGQKTPPSEQKYLNIKCGGYWKENGVHVAFDNFSGEIFVEEFTLESEAIKYANGIEATTKGGTKI